MFFPGKLTIDIKSFEEVIIMGFVIFFFFSWVALAIFTVINKPISIIVNTLIFLTVLIININFSWVVAEEMELIDVSEKSLEYTAYLLMRSIAVPTFILISLNLLPFNNSRLVKALIAALSICLFVGFSFLTTIFNIAEYVNWNYFYDAIYYILLYAITIYACKLYKKIPQNVVKAS